MSRWFVGSEEQIARDLDLPVIRAAAVTPANRPEEEGAGSLTDDIDRHGGCRRALRRHTPKCPIGLVSGQPASASLRPWSKQVRRAGKKAG